MYLFTLVWVCADACMYSIIIFPYYYDLIVLISSPFSVLHPRVSFHVYIFIILHIWVSVFERVEGRVQEIDFSLKFQSSIVSWCLCLTIDSWKFNLRIFVESHSFPVGRSNQFFLTYFGPLETNVIKIHARLLVYISVI